MILVDSSVWIDYFRGTITVETEILDELPGQEPLAIGDLILTEVLQGFDNERDFNEARKMLTALTVVELGGEEIAIQAAKNFRALRRLGVTVRKTIENPDSRDQTPRKSGAMCYTFCIAMRFEREDDKNRINQRRHEGLTFETAAPVFNDPLAVFRKDRLLRAHSGGVPWVHVYHVEDPNDEEENIRIISAREANKRECRIYLQQASE